MKKVKEIIEDIQRAQVEAGGRFMKQNEIKEMRVGELLRLLLPNNVEFKIKHKPRNRQASQHDMQTKRK